MRSRLSAIGVLLLLSCATAAGAVTTLYLTGETDTPHVWGRTFLFTGPDRSLEIRENLEAHTLFVNAHGPEETTSFRITFQPPHGTRFAPGLYRGVAEWNEGEYAPGVLVESYAVDASLTVHDAAYDATGALVRFVADFSQMTVPGPPPLVGAIRMNAGDDDCAGATDGARCDDADACTTTATCAGGRCVSGPRAPCAVAPDECHDAPVCSPLDGACSQPGEKPAIACDDGDACTRYAYCDAGTCVPLRGLVEECRDGTGCAYDQCDAIAGCEHPAIPGACGTPGIASTLAFMDAPPLWGYPHLSLLLVPPSLPSLTAAPFDVGIEVSLLSALPALPFSSVMAFYAADGAPLEPGAYEDASNEVDRPPGRPALVGSLLACEVPETRRFVVHEVRHELHAGDDRIVGFSVDFTARCPSDGTEFRGIIRYRAGDAGCEHAVDGTPCDDLNACTGTSACMGGLCVGGDPVVCPTPQDGCHAAPICDPGSGACLAPAVLDDGTACHDPTRCIPAGECQAGVCTSPGTPCDDFDVCTADRCDGDDRCVHEPLDGTCWSLRGTATVLATVGEVGCSCSVPAKPAPLALHADGTFARPGALLACASGETSLMPAEVGTATRKPGRRLKLATTNLADVVFALERCGADLKIKKHSAWVKVAGDGSRLRGVQVERIKVPDVPLFLTTTIRFRGRPATTGTVKETSIPTGRCNQTLIDCLNDKLAD